jgi:hypothetical protein
MPLVRIKDTDEVVQFPDDMRAQEILSKLREYRPPNYSDALQKPPSMAVAYEPTLAEKMGQGISNALYDSGIISNRFAAQNIGRNATIGAEFMPVIGDALGADELGRAIKEGDATGIGLGALSMVPVVGDAARGVAKSLDTLNPTGTVFTKYNPEFRATAPLGGLLTTYDKTAEINPEELVTIYRGAPKGSKINSGDFVTTNKQLAKDYAGDGDILSMKVRAREIIDDADDPLGEEYIYRAAKGLGEVGDLAKKLPSKGKVITDFYELFEYTPEQLAMQAKFSDPSNVVDGVYTVNKGKFRTEYYDDGTSAIIMNSDGRKIREFNQNETKDSLKNKILEAEAKRPEAVEIELRKQKAREQAIAAESANDSYKIQHTAPMREDNSSGYDVSMSFGDDIYSSNALRFFGTGSSYDEKAINIIQQMKGNPEKNLIVYRAVPKKINEINKGDWVTTTREYAKDHATGEDGWHIISKRVKAKDIATDGNSIHEFGYDPLDQ